MLKTPPQIAAATSKVITTSTTATVTLPTKGDGNAARWVMVTADGYCFVNFGASTITAVATTAIMIPPNCALFFNVSGCTHIATLQKAAGAIVAVSPLENQ